MAGSGLKIMDRYDKQKRSEVMASVKKSNTKLEGRLAIVLDAEGLTIYRRHAAELPGSPDFVFDAARLVVFLDSCYWHGCPKHLRMPQSNVEYWEQKIARNRARDRRQNRELKALGWRVLRLWEHELREPAGALRRLRRALAVKPHDPPKT